MVIFRGKFGQKWSLCENNGTFRENIWSFHGNVSSFRYPISIPDTDPFTRPGIGRYPNTYPTSYRGIGRYPNTYPMRTSERARYPDTYPVPKIASVANPAYHTSSPPLSSPCHSRSPLTTDQQGQINAIFNIYHDVFCLPYYSHSPIQRVHHNNPSAGTQTERKSACSVQQTARIHNTGILYGIFHMVCYIPYMVLILFHPGLFLVWRASFHVLRSTLSVYMVTRAG